MAYFVIGYSDDNSNELIFISRNFSPNFQCAMTSYCRIFCDNLTLTNLQYFNQSPMNDRYSNILNVKEIKLCCLLKANFSTRRSICSLVKVFKLFTSVRLKSVKNSPSRRIRCHPQTRLKILPLR